MLYNSKTIAARSWTPKGVDIDYERFSSMQILKVLLNLYNVIVVLNNRVISGLTYIDLDDAIQQDV